MLIHGIQKMTLLDYPGKVACTVFLNGCDFRCSFCHNWELVNTSVPAVMDDTELLQFLKNRKRLLDGVVFTGGEPLLHKELSELIRKVRDMGFLIKLDTNGNNPDLLTKIVKEGLVDYVAMDIKNSPERYGETIGIPGFDITDIRRSVEFLLGNSVEYEFRTTVIKQFHNKQSFVKITEWISGAANYYLQAFVDRDTVPYAGLEGYTKEEMEAFLEVMGDIKHVAIRGY